MSWGNPIRGNWNMPEDTKFDRTVDSWDINHSQSRHALYIYAADYHLASLKLQLDELRELLKILEARPDTGAIRDALGNNPHPVG